MMVPPRYPQTVELSRTSYIQQLTNLLQLPVAQVTTELRQMATDARDLMRLAANVHAPPLAAISPSQETLQHAQLCGDGFADWATVNAGAPFHHRPVPYYKLQGFIQGRHYWLMVVDVLQRVQKLVGWPRLAPTDDTPPLTNFGDAAYLPELSVYPAEENCDGRSPTDERVQFLATMLRTMRPTARVLVLNGYRTDRRSVVRAHEQLLRAFLNNDSFRRDRPHTTVVVPSKSGKRKFRIECWRADDHLVLITRGLYGKISNEYLQEMAKLIASVL